MALAGHNLAFGIDDGDARVFCFLLHAFGVAFGLDNLGGVVLFVEYCLNILCKAEGVHQPRFECVVGHVGTQVVGGTAQLLCRQAAVGGYVGKGVLPGAVDIRAYLLAVGIAHVGAGIYLTGALVGTRGGTDKLHVDTQFVEQPFVVHHLCADAAEVNDSRGVHGNEVGG